MIATTQPHFQSTSQSKALLQVNNISKSYIGNKNDVKVLDSVSFTIEHGKTVAIIGKSGSGKTTLLSVMSGLESADSGSIIFDNKDIKLLTPAQKSIFLNQDIGFVYQFHHLLPDFSALENVMMPLLIKGNNKKQAKDKASYWLKQVELSHRLNHIPEKLSGGERQRVAVARALVNSPKCLFLDEPTGNLDSQSAANIWQLIKNLIKQTNSSMVVVTHDNDLAVQMDRVLTLKNGCIYSDT